MVRFKKKVKEEIEIKLEDLETNIERGLTLGEVEERRVKYGENKVEEKKPNQILKFLHYFTDSIAILIIIGLILSGIVGDWINFIIIGALLILNAVIGWSMESHAQSAIDSLKSNLSLTTI